MNTIDSYVAQILALIAKNHLDQAISEILTLLEGSPAYSEAILQSGRYSEVMQSIRMGTITINEASTQKNKIRAALIDMIRELEEQVKNQPKLKHEVLGFLQQKNYPKTNSSEITGNGSIVIQDYSGGEINIQINPNNTSEEKE